MAPHFPFFDLPREVRDIIYRHYVFEPDGYHFHYPSGKLRASNDRPIELALMYTSRRVAMEMGGIALESNVVTFSTVYSEMDQMKACRVQVLNHWLDAGKVYILGEAGAAARAACMTSEVEKRLILQYPKLESLIQGWPNWHYLLTPSIKDPIARVACSVYRGFIDLAINTLATSTDFLTALDGGPQRNDRLLEEWNYYYRSPLFLSRSDRWNIPFDEEVEEMHRCLNGQYRYVGDLGPVKRRWSAATAAIHFFKSTRQITRLQMRNILLEEDRESVANPECHALGLIPFCQENAQLRVVRRVSLWRNLLPSLGSGVPPFWRGHNFEAEDRHKRIRAMFITEAFSIWISEAMELEAVRMPSSAFTLVFDGDPVPDLSSEIFDVVRQDVAWQIAKDEWCKQYTVGPSVRERAWNPVDRMNFGRVVAKIAEGDSFNSCNFPIGGMHEVQPVLDRYRNFPRLIFGDDSRHWDEMRISEWKDVCFDTIPPLPSWEDLRFADYPPKRVDATQPHLQPTEGEGEEATQ